MVLHHVAQRAGAVVERGTPLDANGLGDGDLHMVDMPGVPQRLEQRIAEAQRDEVLHGFLAEVVIDAEGLLFGEAAPERIIDGGGGFEVAPDGLFDHDARPGVVEPVLTQALADRYEDLGTGREIEHADAIGHSLHRSGELVPAAILARIEGVVGDQAEEALQGVFGQVAAEGFEDGLADSLVVSGVRQRIARDADEAAARLDLPIGIAVVQGRQQLAHGEITGAAENHEIERVDVAGMRGHLTLLVSVGKNNTTEIPPRKVLNGCGDG